MKKKSLTIIIPAYNESKRIIPTLLSIDSYIGTKSVENLVHVIVVNDGSKDDTEGVVRKWIKSICRNKESFELVSYQKNQGKGFAVREGIERANSDLILYIDADGSIPITELGKLIQEIDIGFDVVCGSKFLTGDNTSVKMKLNRRIADMIFHLILKLLRLNILKDTQCGFKLFKAEIAKTLATNQKCFNYAFDIEYLFLAKKCGYKIKEVPVSSHHQEGSKLNLVVDGLRMLIDIFKIKFIHDYNI